MHKVVQGARCYTVPLLQGRTRRSTRISGLIRLVGDDGEVSRKRKGSEDGIVGVWSEMSRMLKLPSRVPPLPLASPPPPQPPPQRGRTRSRVVNGGSPAEAAGLRAGDAVIKVNNTDMFNLRHKEAQDVIVKAGNNFEITVQRGGSTWKPSVSPVTASLPSPQPAAPVSNVAPVTKTSLAAKKQDGPLIGSGHNFSPKPFLNGTGEGPIKSIVNKQYNSPVGIYSEETIAETLSAQAEVLAGGVLGVNFKKNEKNYNAENSEVFKMVQEADKEPKTPEPVEPTAQSGVITPSSPAVSGLRPVTAPETKPAPANSQTSLPPGQNICADCERLIVGVFVRIKEKNLHVECFKCSTCGTSLKNVGYYNINNKLYCDIHAKLVARQNAPAGLAPVTIPTSGKAPAGTISAALANVGAGSPLAPLSPSLNNHSSPLPFTACNPANHNGPRIGTSQPREMAHCTNGTNGALNPAYQTESCNSTINGSKTFRSTLTIQTAGNEVGSTNDRILASKNNITNSRLNSESNRTPKIGEVCEIIFNPVISNELPDGCCTESNELNTYTFHVNQPTRLGTSPVNPPSLRPVQAPTSNNIGGPKPFGGSSIAPPSLSSPPIVNSGSNTLPRPQSQTVTESYLEEAEYREVSEIHRNNSTSVKCKSLVWPPTKPIEDVTYPTACPLYINPNPALNCRHRELAKESRKSLDVERKETHVESREVVERMEKVSCPGPVYRRVELVGIHKDSRRESRSRDMVPRASSRECSSRPESRESLRRSLTPTKITQPVPQPWTATVTTGTNLYQNTYPIEQKVCQKYSERQVCKHEKISQRTYQQPQSYQQEDTYREERYQEKTSEAPQICQQPKVYHQTQVCEYLQEAEPPSERSVVQSKAEERDLSELVPPNVAVCPKGVEGEHDYYTETLEKDVGPLHIKKTTVYEKTVELVSPDRADSPGLTEVDRAEEMEVQQITDGRTPTFDQEVEDISGRRSVAESAEVVTSVVDTQQMIERIKREEEEERQEEEQRLEEERSRSIREKRVSFSEQREIREQQQQQQQLLEEHSEQYIEQTEQTEVEETQEVAEERYRELKEEIQIQESFRQRELEEQRRQSLREQVEVHQSLREQQAPEKRQNLQERRLCARLSQAGAPQQEVVSETKKHVQFTKQTESGVQALPPTTIKNSTPKEWKSEMVRALTTAPARSYSPFAASNPDDTNFNESYNNEYTYEEIRQVTPNDDGTTTYLTRFSSSPSHAQETPGPVRSVSPFQEALTTAPDRPYTPLGDSQEMEEMQIEPCYESSECREEVQRPASNCQTKFFREENRMERKVDETKLKDPVECYETTEYYIERSSKPPYHTTEYIEQRRSIPDEQYQELCRTQKPVESYESTEYYEQRRSQTPSVPAVENSGYCAPADILYIDSKTREIMQRERSLSRKSMTPQPLPTPPPDYRLRDSSRSPTRSRPETPANRSLMTGLKKPDTIPSYQRNLVCMKKGPVDGQTYIPSRSPTPTPGRSKSPAQGPPEPPACFLKAQAPKVRDDTPPKGKHTTVSSYTTTPKGATVSYHYEEDTPTGHRVQDYTEKKSMSYCDDSGTTHQSSQQFYKVDDVATEESKKEYSSSVQRTKQISEDYEESQRRFELVKSYEDDETNYSHRVERGKDLKAGCAVSQVTRSQPVLPCPIARAPPSEKFPKTGVCVLPPCPKVVSCERSQVYQKSSQQQVCQRTVSQSQPSAFCARSRPCPDTGVTVLPCKAVSDAGTKAGVVVVPCEGPSSSCSQSGICVVPTRDRKGVCVSPCYGLQSGTCGQPSGSCGKRSGGCNLDVGGCSDSGVCVAPCGDGSVCVAPCTIPGVSSVRCPKPILKNQCPVNAKSLPFPQIPFPYEDEDPSPNIQIPAIPPIQEPNDLGFQPIHKPRTNLTKQLTQLTLKKDKHVVQLYKPQAQCTSQNQSCPKLAPTSKTQNLVDPPNLSSHPDLGSGVGGLPGQGSKSGSFAGSSAPKRGRGILNQASGPGSRVPLCAHCNSYVRGPFITALGQIWCPDHFVCVNGQCRRPLQDIGFVEEKGQLYCEYCFEQFIAPPCNKCNNKIKGDCLNAIGKHFHPECFNCSYCGKLFGNSPFFLEEGLPYCESDWNELFTTKCFACGFPVEAGDRWVEALNNNYHSQCFNCTMCKKNLEGQSFYAKGGRPFCKNHAR
ncbi:PDZ and LIM domain protein Zasp isoform X3 [Cephus cinctus]|uniref:PDZ and LIM domain protein Zasp isoform X3 n=1 Tax=Cephus cinctus TaxID=211228 RepID=A0AAJ7RDV9_CEPCN|nr:PDZ and LIM domain protein Zasp isoform X3 [Cephus cinctus]